MTNDLVELRDQLAGIFLDYDESELLAEGERDGLAYATVRGIQPEDDYFIVAHIEAREIEAGEGDEPAVVTATIFWTVAETFEENAAIANEDVEIEGEPILLAFAGEDDDRAERNDDDDTQVSCQADDDRGGNDERDNERNEEREDERDGPDENGLIGDDGYRSPTYGFEVEWSGNWLADDAVIGEGGDQLYLENADNTAQIWLTGLATEEDLDEVRDEFAIGFVSGISEDSELLDRGRSNGAYWATFSIDFEEAGTVLAYVEAREIEAAEPGEPAIVTVAIFFAVEPLYDELIADAAANVELDGEPILVSYE
jgi:hypothetical protein